MVQILGSIIVLKNSLIPAVSVIAVVNYIVSFAEYSSYAYPRDVASELIQENPTAAFDFYCEYENNWSVIEKLTGKEADILASPVAADSQPDRLVMVNSCFFYPVDDPSKYHAYNPTPAQKLVGSEKHFMSFKAYQFEGYKPIERELVDKLGMEIRMYSE